MQSAIIVHGGAGNWDPSQDRINTAVMSCRNSAKAGKLILQSGGSALDAVEAAVRVLEDSPVLDAGRGSYLNSAGEIEMDALIMDGSEMNLGAVAAVKLVKYPISLARRVMTDSNHNFLVGAGAEAFADEIGFPRCEVEDLVTEDQLRHFYDSLSPGRTAAESSLLDPNGFGDTVGAVALDNEGNLAAATSTGGTRRKFPGRVGDSPLVGSGAYADNWTAAVSATGNGEALMKIVISKRVCDFVGVGLSTQKACEAAIDILIERVNGLGGLIALDSRGRAGIAYNTAAMPHAYCISDGSIVDGY